MRAITTPGRDPWLKTRFDITAGERGLSTFDRQHVLALHFVWDVPVFQSQRGLFGKLLGGWSMAGIVRSQSGLPATPQQRNTEARSANDPMFNNAFAPPNSDSRRPFSANPHAPLGTVAFMQLDGSLVDFYQRNRPVTANDVRWIYNNNNAARMFGTPFGVGRNVLRAPAFHQTDLSIFKNIRFSERFQLQLRLEAENAFNHPNYPGIGTTVADLFGFLNPTETQAAPRRLAAGMRLFF
jgi:hypothetical protein